MDPGGYPHELRVLVGFVFFAWLLDGFLGFGGRGSKKLDFPRREPRNGPGFIENGPKGAEILPKRMP